MENTIILSEDKKHQYLYAAGWDQMKPCICFIGLNPRLHDEGHVAELIKYAKKSGYGGIYIVHLFSYFHDNLNPSVVRPIGELTDHYIKYAAGVCEKVVCCWGSKGVMYNRGEAVVKMLTNGYYCEKAANGQPVTTNRDRRLWNVLKPIELLYESI